MFDNRPTEPIIAIPPDRRSEPPWDELDPGIARTVRELWNAGFEPTDSGDGASKADRVYDVPHVIMICRASELVADAHRLMDLVESWASQGLIGELDDDAGIQASYSPIDGVSVLMLMSVAIL